MFTCQGVYTLRIDAEIEFAKKEKNIYKGCSYFESVVTGEKQNSLPNMKKLIPRKYREHASFQIGVATLFVQKEPEFSSP